MKYVKLALCLLMPLSLAVGPFLDLAMGGPPTPFLRVSGGILASLSPDCVDNSSTVWFASVNGSDGNSGHSHQAPKTFNGAAQAAQPGDKVCVMAGTFVQTQTSYPPRAGTASAWIVYEAYGDGPLNVYWAGGTGTLCPGGDCSMINSYNNSYDPNNPTSSSMAQYIEYRGFNLFGQGLASDGFACKGSNHLRYIGNTVYDTNGSGVGAIDCDYLTSDHNVVYHNGYLPPSWTSGISYNDRDATAADCATGLHNAISNNIIVGEYDSSTNHTDGNGIILDLGSTPAACQQTAPYAPATLVVNNVVYGNGSRCFIAYKPSYSGWQPTTHVTKTIWIIPFSQAQAR